MPGASPTAGRWSGVKDSGPQKRVRIPTWVAIGTRSRVVSTKGAIRSMSKGIDTKEASSGMPSSFHAAASGSKIPTIMPPPSSR